MSVINDIIASSGNGSHVRSNGKKSWTQRQMVAALGLKAQGFNNETIGDLTGHPKLSVQYLFTVKLKDAEKKNPSKELMYAYLGVTAGTDFTEAAEEALQAAKDAEADEEQSTDSDDSAEVA